MEKKKVILRFDELQRELERVKQRLDHLSGDLQSVGSTLRSFDRRHDEVDAKSHGRGS